MYPLIRRALFALDPERAHALALNSLRLAHRLHVVRRPRSDERDVVSLMGLEFPNRVGLAAGFDKNARYIDALAALGFGFIEIGTVTPRPQPGQLKPRVFRLTSDRALINRMGFPSEGAAVVASRLARHRFAGVLGVNIGKNAATPLASAIDDYVHCYRALASHAGYVAINVSSPNTKDLRQLQQADRLQPILEALLDERERLAAVQRRRIPLLAKISPDLSERELMDLGGLLVRLGIDGVIATNTTITRPVSARERLRAEEAGGLSGAPLRSLSMQAVTTLKQASQGRLTIIGSGGIDSAAAATNMFTAGADLVQIYTGLIYRGPALVKELVIASSASSRS